MLGIRNTLTIPIKRRSVWIISTETCWNSVSLADKKRRWSRLPPGAHGYGVHAHPSPCGNPRSEIRRDQRRYPRPRRAGRSLPLPPLPPPPTPRFATGDGGTRPCEVHFVVVVVVVVVAAVAAPVVVVVVLVPAGTRLEREVSGRELSQGSTL